MRNLTTTVEGRLTNDPELKYVGQGTPVANFGMAINRRVKTTAGDYEDADPTFLDCEAWQDLAENVTESLSKGVHVIANVEVWTETFTRRDGTTGSKLKARVNAIGPSLRWQTANVTRTNRNSTQGGMANGGRVTGGGYPVWGAPSGGSQADPWATTTNENPPY